MADLDVSSMSDEDLLAAATGTTEPETDVTEDAVGETVTDEVADEVAELPADQTDTTETEHPEGWKPDGPGDRGIALKQERERNTALKAEAEQAKAEAAELRQYRQQIETQQRQAQAQQQAELTLEQLTAQLDFVSGEEAAQVVEQIRQHDAQTMQRQYQQQAQAQVFGLSVDLAREAYPDFQPAIDAAYQKFGPQYVDAMAIANNPRNPAKWAYDLGKSLSDSATIDTRIAEGVAKALPAAIKAALQKQQTPANRGHETIGHVSSHSVAPAAPKDIKHMSQEELERKAGIRK